MDTVNEPGMEEITIMKSSQVGATELILNIVGYSIDQDPCPMMLVMPTMSDCKKWSMERFAPMIRDTACLGRKVSDSKSRDGNNSIFHKSFDGGYLDMNGSNAPSGLASLPIRRVLFDEVDRHAESAGTEGDPISLAKKRANTFWNKQFIYVSTPTDENSRIKQQFDLSDQRHYYVPCPHCEEFHLMTWANIHWDTDEDGTHHPETAAHFCPHCGCEQTDSDLSGMLKKGEWRKHKPEVKGHAGFFINELLSPWVKFSKIVKDFLEAKDYPKKHKVWVNTALGEVWVEGKSIGKLDELMERRENYDHELVPEGVKILTASVDVQDDRFEVETIGWGNDFESWSIERKIIACDTSRPASWKELSIHLRKIYDHELGYRLRIRGTGVDTGFRTKQAYAFCKPRLKQKVFALKGDGGNGKPLVAKPTKSNLGNVLLFKVGTDTAKDTIAGYLRQKEEGPCYCHFPHTCDKSYFRQLLAEKRKKVKGKAVWVMKKEGARNETLDLWVYNLAVLEILGITAERLARIHGPLAGGKKRSRRKSGMISKGAA